MAIWNKLQQVEDAEEKRWRAQIELDQLYDVWRQKLDSVINEAHSWMNSQDDSKQI